MPRRSKRIAALGELHQFPKASSPLLSLPKELRSLVYTYLLSTPSKHIEIRSKMYWRDRKRTVSAQKYICNRDLRILGTCHQLRDEASEVLYNDCIFTIYLYPTQYSQGCPDDWMASSSRFSAPQQYTCINSRRVRNCHIVSRALEFPQQLWYDSSDEPNIRDHLATFAAALVASHSGHRMQFLLIECYLFELALGSPSSLTLTNMVVNLLSVYGIESVHIRALEPRIVPWLKALETSIMRDPGTGCHSKLKEKMLSHVIFWIKKPPPVSDQEQLDSQERATELYARFGVKPLYRDLRFIETSRELAGSSSCGPMPFPDSDDPDL